MKKGFLVPVWLLAAAVLRAGEFDEFAIKALGDVAAYSHKAAYSPTVDDVYLGYDAEGKIVSGAAMRPIKTYSKINGLVAVQRKDGQWVVQTASFPDIARIKDAEKQKKVSDAVTAFAGSVVKDASGALKKVDAVSGATRYQENIYLYFNLLARTAVEEAEKNPDWPRTPLK